MRRPQQFQKPKSEFDTKAVEIRRVNRVVAGGKRFSFRATVIAGNRRGKVGVGVGKGLDVASAVRKATKYAERAIFSVPLKDHRTIPHDVEAKYAASRVLLKPARPGHGLVAGGSVRLVLELAGIKDVSAKILGRTTNKLTNAFAAIRALEKMQQEKPKRAAAEAAREVEEMSETE